jgi:hypothetical protein
MVLETGARFRAATAWTKAATGSAPGACANTARSGIETGSDSAARWGMRSEWAGARAAEGCTKAATGSGPGQGIQRSHIEGVSSAVSTNGVASISAARRGKRSIAARANDADACTHTATGSGPGAGIQRSHATGVCAAPSATAHWGRSIEPAQTADCAAVTGSGPGAGIPRHARRERRPAPGPVRGGVRARPEPRRRLVRGGDRFRRRPGHPTLDLRRIFDWRASGNRGGVVRRFRCIDGERPFRAGPYAIQSGVCVPRDQGANNIALLKRHLDKESRDPGGGWLGLGDVVQCLA